MRLALHLWVRDGLCCGVRYALPRSVRGTDQTMDILSISFRFLLDAICVTWPVCRSLSAPFKQNFPLVAERTFLAKQSSA